MITNPNIPVFFEINEIEDYLKSLPSNKLKLDYLKELYSEFIFVCYRVQDKNLGNYIKSKNLGHKFFPIPYIPSTDKYQTHISMSEYIKFLRLIDGKLLPFVRKEIKKLDKSFKENHSLIIKDYPVFNFNKEKILQYIDTLTIDKLGYIYFMIRNRTEYFHGLHSKKMTPQEIDILLNEDDLYSELKRLQYTLERFPERMNEKNILNTNTEKDEPELFKIDKSLCRFDIIGIKEIAKNKGNSQDAIIYLMHVKKEALQNENLIPNGAIQSLLRYLAIEIDFYKEKQKMENESFAKQSSVAAAPLEPKKDTIRLHWQGDDVLLPYLMKQLFDEGFINSSDYELRRDFIEQSFYKKNKAIYSAKEAGTAESNYKLNKNNKPSKSHKVERVIDSLKSKRDELSEKKTPLSKKK
ncbi:MAG: hypothetical protein WC644_04805 [Ignavibacteria bacterium]